MGMATSWSKMSPAQKARKVMLQRERRHYRGILGLCLHCETPRVPGKARCLNHEASHNAEERAATLKEQRARGWGMRRVEM